MSDRFYWFQRNALAFLANIIVAPVYIIMFIFEALYDGVRYTLRCDGSTVLHWPWEMEWPFMRDEEE